MGNRYVMIEMFTIYGNPTVDWMGYPITSDNPLTYHHIIKNEDNGELSIKNGALLTRKAHMKLHRLEKLAPNLYEEYCFMFRIINDMNCPPTKEIMDIMFVLKSRLESFFDEIKHQKQDETKQIVWMKKMKRAYKAGHRH